MEYYKRLCINVIIVAILATLKRREINYEIVVEKTIGKDKRKEKREEKLRSKNVLSLK